MDDLLTKEFKPCVIENRGAEFTEIVLTDAPIVYVYGGVGYELGYDFETGELAAVRVDGLVSKR